MMVPGHTSLDGFHGSETAQRADKLARAFFDAVNANDLAALDDVAARGFLSYEIDGMRSRTAVRAYHAGLHNSFSELSFEVHENVGVIVEGDLVALRTIITGVHSGEYAGAAPTGKPIQTSATHFFRFRDDLLVERWQVIDTYRILVAIGAVSGVANEFQRFLGVPESPNGLFVERSGTTFEPHPDGRPVTREESRAVTRRLFDGTISTGRVEDADAIAESYIQNNGWTPDGRSLFGA